jgi:hypothetical protein
MWDLGTIQVINLTAMTLRSKGRPERLANCGAERRETVESVKIAAEAYAHGKAARGDLEHYAKDAKQCRT